MSRCVVSSGEPGREVRAAVSVAVELSLGLCAFSMWAPYDTKTRLSSHTHTHPPTHTQTQPPTHTHTHTHTQTYTRTHTHSSFSVRNLIEQPLGSHTSVLKENTKCENTHQTIAPRTNTKATITGSVIAVSIQFKHVNAKTIPLTSCFYKHSHTLWSSMTTDHWLGTICYHIA